MTFFHYKIIYITILVEFNFKIFTHNLNFRSQPHICHNNKKMKEKVNQIWLDTTTGLVFFFFSSPYLGCGCMDLV